MADCKYIIIDDPYRPRLLNAKQRRQERRAVRKISKNPPRGVSVWMGSWIAAAPWYQYANQPKPA